MKLTLIIGILLLASTAAALELYKCMRVNDTKGVEAGLCVWWVPEDMVVNRGVGQCQSTRLTGRTPTPTCEHWLRVDG